MTEVIKMNKFTASLGGGIGNKGVGLYFESNSSLFSQKYNKDKEDYLIQKLNNTLTNITPKDKIVKNENTRELDKAYGGINEI